MHRAESRRRRVVAAVVSLITLIGLVGHALAEDAARADTIRPGVAPGLVTVELRRKPPLVSRLEGALSFSSFVSPGLSTEETEHALGFVLDERGLVLASTRPIAPQEEARITVTLADERSFAAELKGNDPASGLTVLALKEPPRDLVPAKLAPLDAADNARPSLVTRSSRGDVTACPVAILRDEGGTISALAASLDPPRGAGFLLTSKGELLGARAAQPRPTLPFASFPLLPGSFSALRVDVAREIARQLAETGRAAPGWLGATFETPSWIESAVVQAIAKSRGLRVASVEKDGPAFQASLREGDVIVALEGEPLPPRDALSRRVEAGGPGRHWRFDVLRDGQLRSVEVTTGETPARAPSKP